MMKLQVFSSVARQEESLQSIHAPGAPAHNYELSGFSRARFASLYCSLLVVVGFLAVGARGSGTPCVPSGDKLRPLFEKLEATDSVERAGAAALLGVSDKQKSKIVKALLPLCEDESPLVRAATAKSLGALRSGTRQTVPVLIDLLGDSEPTVRSVAGVSLASIGRAARKHLAVAIEEDHNREQALVLLAGFGEEAREDFERYYTAGGMEDDVLYAWAHADPPGYARILTELSEPARVPGVLRALESSRERKRLSRMDVRKWLGPLEERWKLPVRLLLSSGRRLSGLTESDARQLMLSEHVQVRRACVGALIDDRKQEAWHVRLYVEALASADVELVALSLCGLGMRDPLLAETAPALRRTEVASARMEIELQRMAEVTKWGSTLGCWKAAQEIAPYAGTRGALPEARAPEEVAPELREHYEAILPLLASPSARCVAGAMLCIGELLPRDAQGFELLRPLLEHEDRRVRYVALEVVSGFASAGVEGLAPMVLPLMEDESAGVSGLAAMLTLQVSEGAAQAHLEDLLCSDSLKQQSVAVWWMVSREGGLGDDDLAVLRSAVSRGSLYARSALVLMGAPGIEVLRDSLRSGTTFRELATSAACLAMTEISFEAFCISLEALRKHEFADLDLLETVAIGMHQLHH